MRGGRIGPTPAYSNGSGEEDRDRPREGRSFGPNRGVLQGIRGAVDVGAEMSGIQRSAAAAGESAGRRFQTLARTWRRRVLRPILLGCTALVLILAVAGTLVEGQAKFWLGMLAGATMAVYVAVRDSPPWHIEKWRRGQEGERRTGRALRRLSDSQWHVWHDLAGAKGTNIDHVVVGPAGVFLLDSKNYSGEAGIEDGELTVSWLEDPGDGWVCRGMVPKMRAACAELKERIECGSGVRIWVQAVVVLWGRFPERVAQLSDVTFVQGDALVEWLGKRDPWPRPFDARKIGDFLWSIPGATSSRVVLPS